MLFKLIAAVIKDYYAQKRLHKQIIKAPFNTAYLQALINSAQQGVVMEVIQPDGNMIRITKKEPDFTNKIERELAYYKV